MRACFPVYHGYADYGVRSERLYHSGGMGFVYLALDKKVYGRSCIVKQVKEPVRTEDDQKKLEEEALRMSRLNHLGIANILDHFIENGYYFLVVERIQGKTLSEVFEEKYYATWP